MAKYVYHKLLDAIAEDPYEIAAGSFNKNDYTAVIPLDIFIKRQLNKISFDTFDNYVKLYRQNLDEVSHHLNDTEGTLF